MPTYTWCSTPAGYPDFDTDLAKLRKKFPRIDGDLAEVRRHLEENAGRREGGQHVSVPGYGGKLWKIRVANSSKRTGKSGGFRFFYYFRAGNYVYPLRVIDKGERENIPPGELDKSLRNIMRAMPGQSVKATKN